jgi:5-methylcytosine-specific restriction protein A
MSTLDEIAPKERPLFKDLVEAAGVDVTDWGNFKGGQKYASRNPKYCYEWSFVDQDKVVVNLWHDLLAEHEGGILMRNLNMRHFAAQRRGVERRRARAMDDALATAHKQKLPVRVILLGGKRRNVRAPNEKPSKVTSRLLDAVTWSVTHYNTDTGECTLIRDGHPAPFVDQFSVQEGPQRPPERRNTSGQVFVRSAEVRKHVLMRAQGKCEWCGQSGFKTASGGIYLETHHVIPLSENGPDTESNVAALCPNHHRESHHGVDKHTMRARLQARIAPQQTPPI